MAKLFMAQDRRHKKPKADFFFFKKACLESLRCQHATDIITTHCTGKDKEQRDREQGEGQGKHTISTYSKNKTCSSMSTTLKPKSNTSDS